jgi:hypothetical protein
MSERSERMENTSPCTCSVHPSQRGCWNCVNWSGNPLIDEYAMCDEDFNRHSRMHTCKHWREAQNAPVSGGTPSAQVAGSALRTCLTCGRKTCDRQPEDNDPADCKDWKPNN